MSSSCSTCNLQQQLKSSFSGSKIRLIKHIVSIQDANQFYISEIQTLSQHLSSNKNVRFTRFKILQYCVAILLFTSSVNIKPTNLYAFKKLIKSINNLFCTKTFIFYSFFTTRRAYFRHLLRISTIMTYQTFLFFMIIKT